MAPRSHLYRWVSGRPRGNHRIQLRVLASVRLLSSSAGGGHRSPSRESYICRVEVNPCSMRVEDLEVDRSNGMIPYLAVAGDGGVRRWEESAVTMVTGRDDGQQECKKKGAGMLSGDNQGSDCRLHHVRCQDRPPPRRPRMIITTVVEIGDLTAAAAVVLVLVLAVAAAVAAMPAKVDITLHRQQWRLPGSKVEEESRPMR